MSSSESSWKVETQGSSLAFVKPMPKRDEGPPLGRDSSSEKAVLASGMVSASEVWSRQDASSAGDDDPDSPLIGWQLGHFRIESQIGRGGMGAVFRALDTRLDRVVALKVLSPDQPHDHNSIERFRNEAQSAARMDHENIARVYYVGMDQGLSFIAFEFVHGSNVRQLIEQQGLLKPADAVNYALQIASALRHTDAAGVVHRDIKPSNIIITPSGRAKLVDLGLARKRDPQASNDLTVDGTTLGTFDYISPEQAKDPRAVDVRSDIYSLGCTLFHMLTGEPPYPVGTMLQKLLDHQGKEIPDAAAFNPRIPPELSAVVRRMMASDPQDRYASADLLIDDLSLIARRFGLRPVSADGVIWNRPRAMAGWDLWKQYSGWLVTAALLLLIVFVIDRIPYSNPDQQTKAPFTATERGADAGTSLHEQDLVDAHRLASDDQTNSGPSGTALAANLRIQESLPLAVAPQNDSRLNETGEISARSFLSLLGGYLSQLSSGADNPSQSFRGSEDLMHDEDAFPGIAQSDTGVVETEIGELEHADESPPFLLPNTNPFVVIVNGLPEGRYPTLEAACTEAPDNAFVELQYDGVQEPVQHPFRIAGKRLRLRAAKDFRPMLRFALPEERLLAGREESVRMLSVSGGSLEIYNIDVTVHVDPALNIGQWIVFSLSDVDNLELHGVSITLENESFRPASLIEVTETVQSAFTDDTPAAVKIDADDCFFRGEGDLLLVKNVDPARIRLNNVAVALDGTLLRMEGTDTYHVTTDMTKGHDVELELKHVTALLGEGVGSFDVQPNYSVPRLVVDAGDSVISTSAPLIEMQGEMEVRDFQDRLTWSDDATFLQGPSPVWQISTLFEIWDYDRDEFDNAWGRSRHPSQPMATLDLLPPDRGRPFSKMTRLDLRLDATPATNPAFGGASDGTDAGVDWDAEKLPRLLTPQQESVDRTQEN